MPTYQYECDACRHAFEELQSFSDAPLTKCPKCKKKKLRRLLGTGAGLVFKGSGFYSTDYRSESYKSAAQADQNTSKAGESTASKTESKASGDGAAKSATPDKKAGTDSSKSAT